MWARKLLVDSLRAPTCSRVAVADLTTVHSAAGGLVLSSWQRLAGQQNRFFSSSSEEPANSSGSVSASESSADAASESSAQLPAGLQDIQQRPPLPGRSEAVSTSRRGTHERSLGRYSRAPDPPLLTSWLHWAESPEEASAMDGSPPYDTSDA